MRNQLLDTPPPTGQDALVVVAPWWFTRMLRIVSLLFGLATAFLAWRHWHDMPLWALGLVLILAPVFAWAAVHPRGWRRFSTDPFLVADRHGVYLPGIAAQEQHRGTRWLMVPWANISRLRLSKVSTSDGTSNCAAMDVIATPAEISEFFVGEPYRDVAQDAQRTAVAFYTHRPPHPRKVIAQLAAMAQKHGR